jgi:hypothetical protein
MCNVLFASLSTPGLIAIYLSLPPFHGIFIGLALLPLPLRKVEIIQKEYIEGIPGPDLCCFLSL